MHRCGPDGQWRSSGTAFDLTTNTPACAGETTAAAARTCSAWPPHVRGRLNNVSAIAVAPGDTPACTGNTGSLTRGRCRA
jgi:hypothetical protein